MFNKKKEDKRYESEHPDRESDIDVLKGYENDLETLVAESKFLKSNPSRPIPQFGRDELEISDVLGVGGFCVVREVKAINLSPSLSHLQPKIEEQETLGFSESLTRQYMAENTQRDGVARYAIKRLKQRFDQETKRHRGMLDLAIEASFLSSLSHPNIIKMRGLLHCDSWVRTDDFYIVLDRLFDTLQKRIDEVWPKKYKSMGLLGPFAFIGKDKMKLTQLHYERMIVAYDLASCFRYLHSKRIVYRDIKPENIGFDVRGDVKLFDFGLCKEIPYSEEYTPSSTYKLTPRTGSIPYMAPECMLGEKYNHKVDVFSFGILLWEIFALKIPLKGFDRKDYKEKVCKGGFRPNCGGVTIPITTKAIMKECWSENSRDRPEFERIANVIRGDMLDMTDDGKELVQNRTEHKMNRSKESCHRRNGT